MNEEEEPEYKVKKEEPSTSLSLECSSPPKSTSPSSSSSASLPTDQNQLQSPAKSIKKEDIWYTLENGGEIKDLLPAGIIKNSSKLRFDVKEISLAEEI